MSVPPVFRGGVFRSDLPGGRVGADLVLEGGTLQARWGPTGGGAVEGDARTWPLEELTVEMGGAAGRHVFLRRAGEEATVFCDAPEFLEALRGCGVVALAERLAAAEEASGSRRRQSLRQGLTLLGLAALAIAGILWGLGAFARSGVGRLPISVDQKLGAASQALVSGSGDAVEDELLTRVVGEIVARLEPTAALEGFTYEVTVVRSEQVNAFALPGGSIVVFTGLLAKADRPEQVAGVLAHEIAHVTLRHGLRRVVRSAGTFLALRLLLGDAEGVVGTLAGAASEATLLGNSREQEREADREGARMLLAAGLDPEGLAAFFELLESESGGALAPPAWMSTHPEHAERVAEVRRLAQVLRAEPGSEPPRPLALEALAEDGADWAEVRRRAGG